MAESTPPPASRLQKVLEIGYRQRQAQADPLHSAPSENEQMLRVAQENSTTPAPTGVKQKRRDMDCCELCCDSCMRCPACCFCFEDCSIF